MSWEVIEGFFPVVVPLAESHPLLGNILRALFPKHVAEICTVPFVRLRQGPGGQYILLKWPTVAVTCVFGCLLGFAGGGYLLYRTVWKRREKGFFAWGFALFWYGLMCLGGLFYHCIQREPLFYTTDVVGTACSSISVVAGSTLTDDTGYLSRSFLVACYVLVIVLTVYGGQMVREILYLGPTTVAFLAGAGFLRRLLFCGYGQNQAQKKGLWKWAVVAAVGAIAGLGGVVCDKWLCVLFGSNFSMMFWFFVGCNVAIFAFFPIVLSLPSQKPPFIIERKDS